MTRPTSRSILLPLSSRRGCRARPPLAGLRPDRRRPGLRCAIRSVPLAAWYTFLGTTLVLVASGAGHALAHPVRRESPAAGRTVSSIVVGHADPATLPADFEVLIGYRPTAESGGLANPSGGCSTPFGIGPASFEPACRVHDLGYDLLRYAEATDGRLGVWARFELDRRLYVDLVRTCETVPCRTTAAVYFLSLTGNSIRQGYRAPEAEPGLPWAAVGLATAGLSIVAARRRARLDRV